VPTMRHQWDGSVVGVVPAVLALMCHNSICSLVPAFTHSSCVPCLHLVCT
jgi:hypothetical protein